MPIWHLHTFGEFFPYYTTLLGGALLSNNNSRPPRPTRPSESRTKHNSDYDFYPRPSFKKAEPPKEPRSYELEKEFGSHRSKKEPVEKRPRKRSAYAFEDDYLEDSGRKRRSASSSNKSSASGRSASPSQSRNGRSGEARSNPRPKSSGGGQAVATKKVAPKKKQKSNLPILPIAALLLMVVLIVVIFRSCGAAEPVSSGNYTLSFSSQTLIIGESATVGVDGLAPDFDGSITWSSSDSDTVSINNGLMQAKKEGTVTISARVDGENVTGTVQVLATVEGIESLSLSHGSITILSGETFQLSASVAFSEDSVTSYVPIVWSSPNTSVARVSSDGLVTARDVGTVDITASVGNQSDYCTITVVKNPSSEAAISTEDAGYVEGADSADTTETASSENTGNVVTTTDGVIDTSAATVVTSLALNLNLAYLTVSDAPLTLEAYCTPSSTTVDWSSSNATVATVSTDGVVTPKSEGTVIITAKAGSLTASCTIHVTSGAAVAIPESGEVVAPTISE